MSDMRGLGGNAAWTPDLTPIDVKALLASFAGKGSLDSKLQQLKSKQEQLKKIKAGQGGAGKFPTSSNTGLTKTRKASAGKTLMLTILITYIEQIALMATFDMDMAINELNALVVGLRANKTVLGEISESMVASATSADSLDRVGMAVANAAKQVAQQIKG